MANATTMVFGGRSVATSGPLLDFFPPVSRGAAGFWWFDGVLENARLNLVTGARAAVSGVPTASGLALGLGAGASLLTDVPESVAQTLYVVAAAPSATFVSAPQQPGLLGNLGLNASGVNAGVTAFLYSNGGAPAASLLLRSHYDVSSAPANSTSTNTLPVTNAAVPHLYSLTIAPGVGRVSRDHTAGTEAVFADTKARAVNTALPFRIGEVGTFVGPHQQYLAAIYNVVHTAEERATFVERVRQALALDGITI